MDDNPSLDGLFAELGKLSRGEKRAKRRLLYVLMKYEPLDAIWSPSGKSTWASFMKQHVPLVSYNYYCAFKKATELFSKEEIRRMGPDASVVLAKTEEHVRRLAIVKIQERMREQHGFKLTRETTQAIVRGIRCIPAEFIDYIPTVTSNKTTQ